MHRNNTLQIGLFVAACGLAGCATSPENCDPNREDFANNLGCVMNPGKGYQRRSDDLEQVLAGEMQRKAAYEALLAELERDAAYYSKSRQSAEAENARLQAAWRGYKKSLESEMRADSNLARQVASIDSDVEAVKAKRMKRDELARRIEFLETQVSL